MTKLMQMLWAVDRMAAEEQWKLAEDYLEQEADQENARGAVARMLLDELRGDHDSLTAALADLLEGA